MTNEEIATIYSNELEIEDGIMVFKNPAFEGALLGFTENGIAVYSENLMTEALMLEYKISASEAADIISYDTMSAYFGPRTPLIIFTPCYLEEHNDEMNKKISEYCEYRSIHPELDDN